MIAGLFGDEGARRRIGRYALHSVLGEGAHGVVFSGRDLELDRHVAIKVVTLDAEQAVALVERKRAEARAIAALNHPNIVQVFDAGVDGRSVYIVMELFESSLDAWLDAGRSRTEILEVFIRAGRGLAAVHRAGLVHRDFKPSNVLIGSGAVKVADFGLAQEVVADTHDDGVSTTTQVGTPAYMAPEQHGGVATDARADQFAFCVALFEALLGRLPFEANTIEALLREKVAGPSALGELPRWLETVLLRGLSPAPGARYADMEMLVEALLDGSKAPRAKPRPRWLGLGLAAVAVAAGGAVMLAATGPWGARGAWESRELGAALASYRTVVAELTLARTNALAERGRPLDAAALERAHFLALEAGREDLAVRAALDLVYHQAARLHSKERAQRWLDAADALIQREGASDELRSRYLAALGALRLASGSSSAGVASLREAVAVCESRGRCSDAFFAALLGNYGDALAHAGAFEESVDALERALSRFVDLRGADDLSSARTYTRLGAALLGQGSLEAAERRYTQAAAIFGAKADPEHPDAAVAASGLAQIAQARGDLDRARAHYLSAVPGLVPIQRAAALNNLGVMALQAGDLDEAIVRYQSAADDYAVTLGRNAPEVGIVSISLGYALVQKGRATEAVRVLEDAVQICER